LNIFSTNAVLRPLGLTGILFRHYWRNSFSPVRGLLWGTILSNEITSSAVPSNFERAKGVLSAIAFLGCRVYLIAVLLIASSLKIAPLFHDVGFNWNWDNVGFGAIAIVELFVAMLVIGFYNFKPALFVVAGFFLILAGISFYFFVQRVPTCGCFGRIQTPPIFSLSISLIAIGAVAFLIRVSSPGVDARQGWNRLAFGLVGFFAAFAVVWLVEPNSYLYCQVFGGSPLKVLPANLILETDPTSGGEEIRQIIVQNNSSQPIRLVGAKYACGPVKDVLGLPVTIKPFSQVSLQLKLAHLCLDASKIADLARALHTNSYRELSNTIPSVEVRFLTNNKTYPSVEMTIRERFSETTMKIPVPIRHQEVSSQ
jgi:hypothetical protein